MDSIHCHGMMDSSLERGCLTPFTIRERCTWCPVRWWWTPITATEWFTPSLARGWRTPITGKGMMTPITDKGMMDSHHWQGMMDSLHWQGLMNSHHWQGMIDSHHWQGMVDSHHWQRMVSTICWNPSVSLVITRAAVGPYTLHTNSNSWGKVWSQQCKRQPCSSKKIIGAKRLCKKFTNIVNQILFSSGSCCTKIYIYGRLSAYFITDYMYTSIYDFMVASLMPSEHLHENMTLGLWKQGWALRSFPFGMLRSFPFF